MNDIRYDGEWFPMDVSQNSESQAAVVARSDKLGDGCESRACTFLHCAPPLTCIDLWRHAECQYVTTFIILVIVTATIMQRGE